MVLRPTRVVREAGREPLLGCEEVKHFLEVDDDTILALDVIRETPTLRHAEERLLAEKGLAFDLVDLVTFLAERGFVLSIDDAPVKTDDKVSKRERTFFASVPPSAVRWMHHSALLVGVAALVLAAIAATILEPRVRPTYANLLVLPRPGFNLLLGFGVMLANTYVHELAHLFMARSYGIDSLIRVSRRMHIVVLETDVTNAWILPTRQRALIFLAGMMYNAAAASLCILGALAAHHGLAPALRGSESWLLFFAYANVFPITFQFFLWMRTDLYFVLLCLTGERNLFADSKAFLLHTIRRSWDGARGKLSGSCAGCGTRAHAEDPFCYGCGADRPRADPSKMAIRHKSRWTLTLYGLAVALVSPFMLVKMVGVMLLLQFAMASHALASVALAYARGDAILVGESLLVLALILVQVGMLLFVTIPGKLSFLTGWIEQGMLRGLRAANRGRLGATLAVSLLLPAVAPLAGRTNEKGEASRGPMAARARGEPTALAGIAVGVRVELLENVAAHRDRDGAVRARRAVGAFRARRALGAARRRRVGAFGAL